LYCAWRAVQAPGRNAGWWGAVGLFLGLGLLAKQMMAAFLPLMAAALVLTDRSARSNFKSIRPYLAMVIGTIFFLPVVWWNREHDWITLQHTGHHFEGHGGGAFYFLKTLPDFIGGQLLVISPLTLFLVITVSFGVAFRFRDQKPAARWLSCFGPLLLVLFTAMSLRQRVNANWPAVFYPAGLILTAAWACGQVTAGLRIDRWRPLLRPAVGIGAALAVATYLLPFVAAWADFGGTRLDPTARLRGWQSLGRMVGERLQAMPIPERTVLLAEQRQIVSELAFYAPGQPVVYKWTDRFFGIDSQYDLWPGPPPGSDALIVWQAGVPFSGELRAVFTTVEPVGSLPAPVGPGGLRRFELYHGIGLKGWR